MIKNYKGWKSLNEDSANRWSLIARGTNRYEDMIIAKELKLSSDPDTDPDILYKLAHRQNEKIRKNIAANPNTDNETLILLASDTNHYVMLGLARNPNLPKEAFDILSDCMDQDILINLIYNPNCPIETLIKLAESPNKMVQSGAKNSPRFPEDIAGWSIGLDGW